MRVVITFLKLFCERVSRVFSCLLMKSVIFCMGFEKVKCMSYIRLRVFSLIKRDLRVILFDLRMKR